MSAFPCVRRPLAVLARMGAVLMLVALGACALPQAREGETRVFALSVDIAAHAGGNGNRQVLVDAPSAAGLLDSDRIVVRAGVDELGLLRGARWSTPLPQLWQGLVIRAIEDDGRLRAGRERDVLAGDERLIGELRRFEFERETQQVHIHFHAKRVDPRQRIVAERDFKASAGVRAGDAAAVVAAFNEASAAALSSLIEWLVAERP
ncbi:ABC-type transport auxiliary lipoprotein family protein [Aquimonas voraii]|uniref:ABC-type transport auxiliary lipoprotein component n=1 Tax=Aquimonas voraii TaxID=265719 RepID=A0A1G6SEN3_9GAMM|nr:ABC-type transport auxiliary lipoprotein family protein [Aquimonas voraii]SDD15332.1 ABC-type transport auxiliary lipoprotein component [Aquimonas voraii]